MKTNEYIAVIMYTLLDTGFKELVMSAFIACLHPIVSIIFLFLGFIFFNVRIFRLLLAYIIVNWISLGFTVQIKQPMIKMSFWALALFFPFFFFKFNVVRLLKSILYVYTLSQLSTRGFMTFTVEHSICNINAITRV